MFLIAETAYCITLDLIFMYLFIRRVLKLDKMGDNLDKQLPSTIWAKLGLLIVAMVLCLVHIVLSFNNQDYWLSSNPDYSLASLTFIVNYALQLYIVLREVRKSLLRYRVNAVYWALCALTALLEVVFVQVTFPSYRYFCQPHPPPLRFRLCFALSTCPSQLSPCSSKR